jgi:CheY-like chemotaxis protein
VTVVNDGQEALDLLSKLKQEGQTTHFDAVLMDLQMPVMDGLTATKLIRQELALDNLIIVAMTANAMKKDRDACLEVGMNDHLGKPFDVNQVCAVLQELWKKSS